MQKIKYICISNASTNIKLILHQLKTINLQLIIIVRKKIFMKASYKIHQGFENLRNVSPELIPNCFQSSHTPNSSKIALNGGYIHNHNRSSACEVEQTSTKKYPHNKYYQFNDENSSGRKFLKQKLNLYSDDMQSTERKEQLQGQRQPQLETINNVNEDKQNNPRLINNLAVNNRNQGKSYKNEQDVISKTNSRIASSRQQHKQKLYNNKYSNVSQNNNNCSNSRDYFVSQVKKSKNVEIQREKQQRQRQRQRQIERQIHKQKQNTQKMPTRGFSKNKLQKNEQSYGQGTIQNLLSLNQIHYKQKNNKKISLSRQATIEDRTKKAVSGSTNKNLKKSVCNSNLNITNSNYYKPKEKQKAKSKHINQNVTIPYSKSQQTKTRNKQNSHRYQHESLQNRDSQQLQNQLRYYKKLCLQLRKSNNQLKQQLKQMKQINKNQIQSLYKRIQSAQEKINERKEKQNRIAESIQNHKVQKIMESLKVIKSKMGKKQIEKVKEKQKVKQKQEEKQFYKFFVQSLGVLNVDLDNESICKHPGVVKSIWRKMLQYLVTQGFQLDDFKSKVKTLR